LNRPPPTQDALTQLLQLEQELLQSDSIESFSFVLVNRLRALISYRQATLWMDGSGVFRIERGTDLTNPDPNAPYLQWLSQVVAEVVRTHPEQAVCLDRSKLSRSLEEEWGQHNPGELLIVPLSGSAGKIKGVLVLSKAEKWRAEEELVLNRLAVAAALVLHSHLCQRRWKIRLSEWFGGWPLRKWVPAVLLISLFLIPVRLSSIAPAEIIGIDTVTVTSPVEGVVQEILVKPNQSVTEGQLLVQLDDRALKGQLKIERNGAEVVRAELLRASQQAFEGQAGEEVHSLRSRLRQHQARVEWVERQLKQLTIRAPVGGVVVSAEIHSWKGRPVRVGEKIMMLADPDRVEVEMWLPVEDLLPPSEEKAVSLYLYRHGNERIDAVVDQVGYRAELSPQGVLSYRLTADLSLAAPDEGRNYRIGERGTARVYGPERSLFDYLFRKPMFWIRSWIG